MSKFLSEIKGFTPVIDILAKEIGMMQALVYGIVWRYCQMENRVCSASLDKIADRVNISRATVKRHIKELCKAGYLKDLTPNLRNHPHTYMDTGKVKIKSLLTVEVGGSEKPIAKMGGGSEKPTKTQEVGQRDPRGGSERPMKIPSKIVPRKESIISSTSNEIPDSGFDKDGAPIDKPKSKKRYVHDYEYEHEDGTIETIEDDSWKQPQKQIDYQALGACGRESFHTKKEYNRLRKIEAMLESGKLSEEFWCNRMAAAEKHHWSFPKLLSYTLSVDLQRKWKRQQRK